MRIEILIRDLTRFVRPEVHDIPSTEYAVQLIIQQEGGTVDVNEVIHDLVREGEFHGRTRSYYLVRKNNAGKI